MDILICVGLAVLKFVHLLKTVALILSEDIHWTCHANLTSIYCECFLSTCS